VQSSDNMYAQYRFLLSDSFTAAQFIDETNWQGVVATPVIESRNFVEGKGIYGELQKRNDGYFVYGIDKIELIDGYINSNGIVSWGISKYAAIKVNAGNEIKLVGPASGSENYCFVKSCDFSIISQNYDYATGWSAINTLYQEEISEIVPDDAKYLLIQIIRNGTAVYPRRFDIDGYDITKALTQNLDVFSVKNDCGLFISSLYNSKAVFGYLDSSNRIVEYGTGRHIVVALSNVDFINIKSNPLNAKTAIAFVKTYDFGAVLPYTLDLATGGDFKLIDYNEEKLLVPSDAKYMVISESSNVGGNRLPEKLSLNGIYDLTKPLWDKFDADYSDIVDKGFSGNIEATESMIKYFNKKVSVNDVNISCFKDGTFSLKGTSLYNGGRTSKLCETFSLPAGKYTLKLNYIPQNCSFFLERVSDDGIIGSFGVTSSTININETENCYIGCNLIANAVYDAKDIKIEVLRVVEKSVNETAYDAYARSYSKSLKEQLDNEIGLVYSNPIGSWWNSVLPTKVADINAHGRGIGFNGIGFIFITDYHYGTSNNKSHAIIKYIQNNTSVQEVVYGGDTTDSWGLTPEQTAEKLRQIYNEVFKTLDIIPVRGNHDINPAANDDSDYIPDSAYYDIMLRHLEKNSRVKMDGHPYYYVDNDVQKIRYIILDWGSNVHNPWDDGGLQAAFLKAKLTELSSEWSVIIFSHGALAKDSVNDEPYVDARSQYMFDAIDDVYDSLNCTLIAVIAGHQHRDMSKIMPKGYNVIVTTCDSSGANAAYDWNDPIRENGTTNECAFDVVQVDKTNRKIYYTRIGSGTNREFSY
ncbi:MAG: hypothetical protein J6S67_16305, partial [Methanobrevibacter sp.]|nr:hypothetical protein [Methanobrevibacter sp.]